MRTSKPISKSVLNFMAMLPQTAARKKTLKSEKIIDFHCQFSHRNQSWKFSKYEVNGNKLSKKKIRIINEKLMENSRISEILDRIARSPAHRRK